MQLSLPKHLQIKKNHHYVWANYLRNWSNNNGNKVWFVTEKSKVIHESTKMVAKEKFFYKIQHLTNDHITCIGAMASLSSLETEQVHLQLLNEILTLQRLEQLAEQEDKISIEIKQEIKVAKENWLENKYTEHETRARIVMSKLAKGRLSALNDETNFNHFCRFFGHQFARTKSFRSTANILTNRISEKQKNQQYLAKILKECRWFNNYLIGENIGASIYQTKNFDNYCMLINHTEEPFITSDQPVINVHDSITDEIKLISANKCDLYYPLSPKYALIISSSNEYPKGDLKINLATVQKLNTKLAKKAHIHIFSSQESVTKRYTKCIGYKDQQIQNQELPDFS